MILTPVAPIADTAIAAPVALRLIGLLDESLTASVREALAYAGAARARTLIVLVRDLVVMRDENLERFIGLLEDHRDAGHRIVIETTPAWRKAVAGRGVRFDACTQLESRSARRQIMICHSSDKRVGAA